MKQARNAFRGYSYQERIIFFLLAKMDLEREIDEIEVEADVQHKFDDAVIKIGKTTIYCQMKDMKNVTIDDLKITETSINIKGDTHSLSLDTNILFFKDIQITPNSTILGISSFQINNIHIVSLSRREVHQNILDLYKIDPKRESILNGFFSQKLDTVKFSIFREELPAINIFRTELLEETIDVSQEKLKFNDILWIEGKPGIGKSHFVNFLKKDYPNHILYRFWVSNQDKDYRDRLLFSSFLSNLSKEIFSSFKPKSEGEILNELENRKGIVIIDGFDHVENYNREEIDLFVTFIEKLKVKCKVIVLSRPLNTKLDWDKWTLTNWDKNQTKKVLDELYHITDYQIRQSIYKITRGYPILIRFIAEHYKQYSCLPNISELGDTEEYYNEIIKDVKTKRALSLFLSSSSFFMTSEFSLLMGEDTAEYINEFVDSYPYLFEVRLNRVSLFHDSFNTYLRNLNLDFSSSLIKVTEKVYQSVMNTDTRFLSRFSSFDFDKQQSLKIFRKYSDIKLFKQIAIKAIDFEAIRTFYKDLREALVFLNPEGLSVYHYYDFSLISNIVARDHISTIYSFYYTYAKTIFENGFSIDDITSSDYLFGVIYFMETSNDSLLRNVTGNNLYDTDNFYYRVRSEIYEEEDFFLQHYHKAELDTSIINVLKGKDSLNAQSILTEILENLYIHKTEIPELKKLQTCIETYIDEGERKGTRLLEGMIESFGLRLIFTPMILRNAKKNILALGFGQEANKYRNSSLEEFILTRKEIGSFSMREEISSYLRLALREERKVDINGIGLFWLMYYERKDTTVLNLPVALKVYEKLGLLSESEGFDLVVKTQLKSEKGIRHLLSDYIEIHSPEMISFALNSYPVDDLEITWFSLSSSFINVFPDSLFEYALKKIVHYHQSSQSINISDVENLFNSNRWNEFVEIMRAIDFKLNIEKDHELIDELKELEFIEIFEEEERYKEIKDENSKSLNRYADGILTAEDIHIIDEKQIDISEIGSYRNGYYSVFSDLEIFKPYGRVEVKKSAKVILHSAITSKLSQINAFGNLFYLVGNLPKFMQEYDVDVDFNQLYKSFDTFLELSLLKNN